MERKLRHFVRDNPILRAGAVRLGAALKSMDRAGFGLFPLVYHHVPIGQQHRFEAQLCFLKRYGSFIAPDEAVSRLREGWPARERAFLLTFDDGYADNVDVVLPVLQAHSITALLFLVAGWLEEPPRSANRTEGYMTAGDAKTWLAAGMKIGSHSYSHRRFSTIDAATVRHELESSREALGRLAGAEINDFACPWGVAEADFDPRRDPELAQASGYRTFFTTRRGVANAEGDLMLMPRHVLEPEWGKDALRVLLGGWKRANG